MENERKELMLNNFNNNIFNIDYENQNVENNCNFNKWKESINYKYNGKGNIYKCPFEKHYFYGEEKEYRIVCPSCNKEICNYCLLPIFEDWNAKCCTKRKLLIMHNNGTTFSNLQDRQRQHGDFYDEEVEEIIFFIPGISLIFLVGIFFNAFFYKIVRKYYDKEKFSITYEDHLREVDERYWVINIAINGITSIIMVIPFFIFNIAISLLLLILIIIRSKWYFYLIGFFNEDFYFLKKQLDKIC